MPTIEIDYISAASLLDEQAALISNRITNGYKLLTTTTIPHHPVYTSGGPVILFYWEKTYA